VQIIKLLLCIFLHSPDTSSLLDLHMLYTKFSISIKLRFSRSVNELFRTHIELHSKTFLLYISFIFFRIKLKIKSLHRMAASVPWLQPTSNFSLNMILIRQCYSHHIDLIHPFKSLMISPCILISNHHHVFSVMSSAVCLTGTNKCSAVSFVIRIFPPNILTF